MLMEVRILELYTAEKDALNFGPYKIRTFLSVLSLFLRICGKKEERFTIFCKPLVFKLLQTGLEPVQSIRPGDFKSPASTIPPL